MLASQLPFVTHSKEASIPTEFLNSFCATASTTNKTATTWSKTKNMTVVATDSGSGAVKIAFNNINNYVTADKNSTT